jgi:hypothetical protein
MLYSCTIPPDDKGADCSVNVFKINFSAAAIIKCTGRAGIAGSCLDGELTATGGVLSVVGVFSGDCLPCPQPSIEIGSGGGGDGDAPPVTLGNTSDRGAFRCSVCAGVPLQRVRAAVNSRANCILKSRHVKNDGIACVNQIWDKDGHQLVTNEGLLRRTRRCGGRYGESIGLSGVASVAASVFPDCPRARSN